MYKCLKKPPRLRAASCLFSCKQVHDISILIFLVKVRSKVRKLDFTALFQIKLIITRHPRQNISGYCIKDGVTAVP